jgi:hypothetical protein
VSLSEWKEVASLVQSGVTVASMIIGGAWVYAKFVRQQERYPNIEFSSDIQFIGTQAGFWIAELIATVENRGKAQHRMTDFRFDLNSIQANSEISTDDRWGGQVNFPVEVATGSFLPKQFDFFFVDPGVKAKYSYITRIPVTASFALLHCRFRYGDARGYSHTAERTIAVPQDLANTQPADRATG